MLSQEMPPGDEEEFEEAMHEAESDEGEDRELEPQEATRYRAIAARLNYLAPDRVDIQFAVKESARAMSSPRKSHWAMLNIIGRYLIKHTRVVIKFDWQLPQNTVTTYSDSDWAGPGQADCADSKVN